MSAALFISISLLIISIFILVGSILWKLYGQEPPMSTQPSNSLVSNNINSLSSTQSGLFSPNSQYVLYMNEFGQFTIQSNSTSAQPLVQFPTPQNVTNAPFKVTLDSRGELVLSDKNNNPYYTYPHPSGSNGVWYGYLEDDGKFCIYDNPDKTGTNNYCVVNPPTP